METTINNNSKPNKILGFFKKIKDIWLKIWSSKLLTFALLFTIFAIIGAVVLGISAERGGFFHINSDDVLQYYPYINNLFNKIKNGTLSIYDTTLYGGTSLFGSVYYLPFDIFTLLAFLLSYIIPAETAYSIVNFMKPTCGALLFYYFLVRKNFNIKTAFITALIYMIGGVTESYYIFPVYLGINFYAPLAMIIIDWCLEKKGVYYYLLSVYSVVVILYDFYMAYMLLAFSCVYFLIACHTTDLFSFFGKNTIFKNKEFWIRFLEFMFFTLLGVMMAAFFLIPSAFYVLNESSRNGSVYKQDSYNWYYAAWDNNKNDYVFSLKHYFTQWCNIFIPNEPHRFCLNKAGDYMREHASLYLTSGGLVYLFYFFFINKKRENRMKFWVVLFNILFMIPLFAKIFCFNEIPYSRWFFIPYLINLYAMAMGMDNNDGKLSDNSVISLIPTILLYLGLGTLIYVLIKAPDIFIHYEKSDAYFKPILIGSIVCIGLYLTLLNLNFIVKITKKAKLKNVFKIAMPLLIIGESVFAGVIIFSNCFNTSAYYYNNKNQMTDMKNTLVENGFDEKDGYRINLYTNSAKATANANILIGDVNFGRFFQSFYNTPLTDCMSDIYKDNFGTSWNRLFNGGYSLMSANVFNVKYVVSHSGNQIPFPTKYYKEITNKNDFIYYEDLTVSPFIVYDTLVDDLTGSRAQLEAIPLFYAYAPDGKIGNKEDDNYKENLNKYKNKEKLRNSGIEVISQSKGYENLINYFSKEDYISSKEIVEINNEEYYKFEAPKRSFYDVLHIFPTDSTIRRQAYENIYVVDEEGNYHATHYYTFFRNDITPKEILVKKTGTADSTSIYLSSYKYKIIDEYLATQNLYKEKSFTLDGSKMHISYLNMNSNKVQVIKTGYTYSDDWKIKTEGYETVNIEGGFLGIIVPKGVKNVDIDLKYEPAGMKAGILLSILSSLFMAMIGGVTIYFIVRKKKNPVENQNDQKKKELFQEIVRFLVVGGLATICDYIVFYLANLVLLKGLPSGVNLAIATVLGFTVGLLVNWFLQRFVFKYVDKSQTKSTKVFIKFVVLSLIGLGITELGMLLSTPLYGKVMINVILTFDFIKLFMKVLMTCIVLVFNYIGRKLFVFKVEKNEVLNDSPTEEQL